jgi:hypothetical protein
VKGDPGPPAKEPLICGWKVDAKNFRAVPFGADGRPLPALDLYPLFQACSNWVADEADAVRREMEHELWKAANGIL